MVANFADVEKQFGTDILIRSLELCELLQSVALRLEVVDKGTEQKVRRVMYLLSSVSINFL